MIFSAIICKNPEVENILNRDDIATEILKKPQELTLVIELYMSSISTMLSPEGKKPQPPETKRLQIKK